MLLVPVLVSCSQGTEQPSTPGEEKVIREDTAASDTRMIEVIEDTSPRVVIDALRNDTLIKEGEAVSFAATITGGNEPVVCVWDFGNSHGRSDREDPGRITFNEAGTFPVQVCARDRDGDTGCDSVIVEVSKNIPTATIESPERNTAVFQGQPLVFKGSVAGGNGPLRYSWDLGAAAPKSSKKDPGRVVIQTPGVHLVTFTVEDANGDRCADSLEIRVRNDTKPVAKIVSPLNDPTVLEGDSLEFQGAVQGGDEPLNLVWSFEGVAPDFSGLSPGRIVFSSPGTYRVIFSADDATGDVSVETRTVTVVKDTTPVVRIMSPEDGLVITEKALVQFEASVREGNEPLTYQWDLGGAGENSAEQDPGEQLLNTMGTFRVVLTVTDADGDTGTDLATIRVAKDTQPRAAIISPAQDLRIYEGESAVFAGAVRDGNMPIAFTWDFKGGADKSSAEDPGEVVFDKAGTYAVTFLAQDSDGDTDSDSVTVTVIKSMWLSVAGGGSHSVGLKTDGSLWAWGWNMQGQMGNGQHSGCTVPMHIGTERDWVAVSCGSSHTLALKADGSLWAWGSNTSGQMGTGTMRQASSPVRVGREDDWGHVAAGSHHSLAVRSDGSLWAWGRNTEGQLGTPGLTYSTTPVRIGDDLDWELVAAGEAHSLAIKKDGTLWCWGSNELGQLGDGSQVDSPTPRLIESDAAWVSIAAGKRHSLAVKQDGTLWAWGANLWGQLGDGTKVFKSSPVRVGKDSGWAYVCAGEYHSAALKREGSIWTWGWNAFGQLGINSLKDIYVPTRIRPDTDWAQVAAGLHHTLAVKNNGTLWIWGYNGYGQLGDRSSEDRCLPILVR